MLGDLFATLSRMGIDPIGHENAGRSIYVEKREIEIPYSFETEDILSQEAQPIAVEMDLRTITPVVS